MNRLRKPLTERNYRIMRAAYLKVGRDFVDRVKRFGVQVVTDGDVKTADVQPVVDAYKLVYNDSVIRFAKYGRAQLKQKKAGDDEMVYSRWQRDIESMTSATTGKFIRTIQTTTIDEIQRIVGLMTQEGIDEGLSIESIAGLINSRFAKEWGDASKWMSRRIAQTETIRASNYGTRMGVDSLGIEYVQSWLCTQDGRERETHAQAAIDNDRIPSSQRFVVGGYECEYPGDPNLPPEESINCRCSWTAEPVD
jgi:hypothetical protein